MKSLQSENDIVLVSLLKKGEIKAFDTLFYKYNKKIYRFSFSLLKNKEDSKEIVQEVFLRIWKKRDSLDLKKSFKSLLFSITYHLIIDQLRIRMKELEYRKSIKDYFQISSSAIDSSLDHSIIIEHIESAVEELPAKRKRIYKLSREKGLTYNDIAKELGISTKTVENQIHLSIKHLKLRIGRNVLQ